MITLSFKEANSEPLKTISGVEPGHCDVSEEVEDSLICFCSVATGTACTVVLRGAIEKPLDEAERSLKDALTVLVQTVANPRITLGCVEMNMAKAVDQAAL
jgi:T-complex protein 1 subunit beta